MIPEAIKYSTLVNLQQKRTWNNGSLSTAGPFQGQNGEARVKERQHLLQVLIIKVPGKSDTEAQLQLIEAQLQEVVH